MAAVLRCLESRQICEGPRAAILEKTLAFRLGGQRAIAVGSGSQALWLALRGVGVGAGNEVIVPTYVCPEVLAVVEDIGATPTLVDVKDDYLVAPDEVADACTERTAAIIVPYLFGTKPELDRLEYLGLPVIADWAQYIPSRGGEPCRADAKILSFQATKVLTAGEGGAVLADESLAANIARLKTVDDSQYKKNLYPLSDLQAALAKSQLDRIDVMLARRKSIADRYFAELGTLRSLRLPVSFRDRSIFFRYPVVIRETTNLDNLIARFHKEGVAVRRPVDMMLHQLRGSSRCFPVAERLFAMTLSLPLYPAMSDQDVEKVIAVARGLLR